jgi:hypothetical protein
MPRDFLDRWRDDLPNYILQDVSLNQLRRLQLLEMPMQAARDAYLKFRATEPRTPAEDCTPPHKIPLFMLFEDGDEVINKFDDMSATCTLVLTLCLAGNANAPRISFPHGALELQCITNRFTGIIPSLIFTSDLLSSLPHQQMSSQ